jgi:hypothetical protein
VGVGNKVVEASLGRGRIPSLDVLDSLVIVGDRGLGLLDYMAWGFEREVDFGRIGVWNNGEKRNSREVDTFGERSD